jgi:MFS family permease
VRNVRRRDCALRFWDPHEISHKRLGIILSNMGDDDSVSLSWRYRVALAVLACLQNSLVGGLVYGWASIMPMLTASLEDGGANLSHAQTMQIFSWASCVGMVSALVLGWVLDRFGPRVCSVIGNASVGIGCRLFAVSTEFESFAIATLLMSFGGPGIQVSIIHLANLFPENQFLTLSFLNGTISFSFAVLAGFDYLWETYPTVTYRALFEYFSLLILLSLIASVIYWPDKPFEPQQKRASSEPSAEDDYIEASTAYQHLVEQPLDSYLRTDPNHREVQRSMSYIFSQKAIESGNVNLVNLKDQPFRKQLFSGTYIRALLCFIISCFLANFYVGSISTEVRIFD